MRSTYRLINEPLNQLMMFINLLPSLKRKSLGIFKEYATLFPREIASRQSGEDSGSIGLEKLFYSFSRHKLVDPTKLLRKSSFHATAIKCHSNLMWRNSSDPWSAPYMSLLMKTWRSIRYPQP